MTEDELDLLASAYLDGEATSEEVAMVERDPELLARFEARVEAMQAISGQLGSMAGPPPALKEQHLAAAMAAFDNVIGDPAANPDQAEAPADAAAAGEANNVLDFTSRAQANEAGNRTKRARPAGAGGLPSWMPAAAVFVLITGGVVALISTSGSDDDAFDTATEAFDTEESAEAGSADLDDDAADESAAIIAESEPAADREASADEEAMEEAMEDDAMEDDEAMEDSEDAEAEGADAAEAAPTTTAQTGGLFPQEPVLFFDELPQDLLAELASVDELRDITQSNCAPELTLADGVEVVGYLPVELAGLPAELFSLIDQSGQELAILVDAAACIPIE